jgi:hypothetical protein
MNDLEQKHDVALKKLFDTLEKINLLEKSYGFVPIATIIDHETALREVREIEAQMGLGSPEELRGALRVIPGGKK